MPYAHNGAIDVYYETAGDASAPPIVFVEGFTMQLVGWHPRLVARFVDEGFRPVLLDNRDVGLSSMTGGPTDVDGGYTVDDMAADVVAVIDDLGYDTAHVVGQSMGGMIAQALAARHPERVRSLNLVYTAPLPLADYAVKNDAKDLTVVQETLGRDAAIEAMVDRERVSSSPGFPFDEAWIRELAASCYDRSYRPDGFPRQAAAMARSVGVLPELGTLTVPVSIIHGDADAHLDPRAAVDLHRAIPGSELHVYAGMGHELVEPLWDEYVRVITRTARRAEPAAG
ncbi:alpha/beta hydrolase [Pseudonocardia sp. RS11V-5]|uniref:alpha/beta fold hydrolase n=1 Tax=Pseudonocardia terrae TaxID=2905831 RepID=UPI001E4DD8A6|nr:alpha/beta hydrolase [Pseudonocardia terrae]MCE3555819.1 alpha/beta hydrolase [Pseudonocardia terrae]